MDPRPLIREKSPMKEIGYFLLFLIAWFVLVRWVLPRLGMPT